MNLLGLSPANSFALLGQPTASPGLLGAVADRQPSNPVFDRNSQWSVPSDNYLTALPSDQEAKFQDWVQKNKIPFDPSPTADYDMRGFWQELQAGGPNAQTGINPNDGQLHFNDYYKTPYHESFSSESKWAKPNAPSWNDKDQLVTPDGTIVFDERSKYGRR